MTRYNRFYLVSKQFTIIYHLTELGRWRGGKESACQCRRGSRFRLNPSIRKIPLEKAMATHSSTLAWEISWTEEPGRLQSMGSRRLRHDLAHMYHFTYSYYYHHTKQNARDLYSPT